MSFSSEYFEKEEEILKKSDKNHGERLRLTLLHSSRDHMHCLTRSVRVREHDGTQSLFLLLFRNNSKLRRTQTSFHALLGGLVTISGTLRNSDFISGTSQNNCELCWTPSLFFGTFAKSEFWYQRFSAELLASCRTSCTATSTKISYAFSILRFAA